MYLNVFLVLMVSLISILLIRMPGVIPSQKDKNATAIQFVINQMIERTEKIAVILVDDGSGNQLGFELLGQSLSATKSTAKIHVYEATSDASQFALYQPKDIENSCVKYFQDLSIHTYTN